MNKELRFKSSHLQHTNNKTHEPKKKKERTRKCAHPNMIAKFTEKREREKIQRHPGKVSSPWLFPISF